MLALAGAAEVDAGVDDAVLDLALDFGAAVFLSTDWLATFSTRSFLVAVVARTGAGEGLDEGEAGLAGALPADGDTVLGAGLATGAFAEGLGAALAEGCCVALAAGFMVDLAGAALPTLAGTGFVGFAGTALFALAATGLAAVLDAFDALAALDGAALGGADLAEDALPAPADDALVLGTTFEVAGGFFTSISCSRSRPVVRLRSRRRRYGKAGDCSHLAGRRLAPNVSVVIAPTLTVRLGVCVKPGNRPALAGTRRAAGRCQ